MDNFSSYQTGTTAIMTCDSSLTPTTAPSTSNTKPDGTTAGTTTAPLFQYDNITNVPLNSKQCLKE